MSSFFHGYLSESDDGCATEKTSPEGKDVYSGSFLNAEAGSDQCSSEKSDHVILKSESGAQDCKDIDHLSSETREGAVSVKQGSSRIEVKKSGKKKKNKYLNEFLQVSSRKDIKTLGAQDLKKSVLETDAPGQATTRVRPSANGELKQSVNQKRKHQVSVLLTLLSVPP
ncbi:hypothetical protein OJ252_3376 [Cryptosporidium canis]|uniref:Uncharacterized protein n=1 Tax=Cryptosporidium canis TaxID=195482 RepID=A0ABQ8P2I2_9CRYT|nr:hypothetical protein OJ252_3376 [Cryptosporidium canis]